MNLSALFQAIINIAKTDALKPGLPALAAFFNTVAANPTAVNFTLALTKLEADLLAALPGVEQDILKQIAADVNAAAQHFLAPPAKS